VATYERAFSDLARAAAWDCRTPQDYLRGTPTPERGTKRGNAPRLTERMAARLAPEEGLIRLNHARVLMELGEPAQLRQAVAEEELEADQNSGFPPLY
jgi:hypothetical protein